MLTNSFQYIYKFSSKKISTPFSSNQYCSVSFCNYEPIVMKFAEIVLLGMARHEIILPFSNK